jgi:uncharacterized protein YjgD (DUF1641 family)
MLLAYKAGLLKPGYPHREKSYVRERLILNSIAAEHDTDRLLKELDIHAAVIPLLKPDAVSKTIQNFVDNVFRYYSCRELHYITERQIGVEHLELIKVFKALNNPDIQKQLSTNSKFKF